MPNIANIEGVLKYCNCKRSNTGHYCGNIAAYTVILAPKKGTGKNIKQYRCEEHKQRGTGSKKVIDHSPFDQTALLGKITDYLKTIIGKNIKSNMHTARHLEVKYIKDAGVMCYQNYSLKWKYVYYHQIKYVSPLTALQDRILNGEICPYCKRPSEYIDSSFIYGKSYGMIYICKACDAYCGVHEGSDKALGRLANAELREFKKQAHAAFDPIWKSNSMTRQSAYKWLSEQLNTPPEYTHIGMFGVETCKKLIEICKKELA